MKNKSGTRKIVSVNLANRGNLLPGKVFMLVVGQKKHSIISKFFSLSVGWLPTANFGTLSTGQPLSPNVDHCVIQFQAEGHWEPCNEVGFELGAL